MQVSSALTQSVASANEHSPVAAEGASARSSDQVQVRTWLGDDLITDFTTPADAAPRHIAALAQLVPRLRLTVDVIPAGDR